jgi:putative tryptophan/tyrosine transport system substrate-binding protein
MSVGLDRLKSGDAMKRREFITLLGGAAAAWPIAASAQQGRQMRRIGFLMSYREGDPEGEQRLSAFRESLRQAGWVDGQTARVHVRWFDGDPERAKAHAKELVEQSPDVIVANGTPAVAALRQLTSSIPIVFVVVVDPVGAGFVKSLSRPGGNITGFSTFEPQIGGKWLELLKEIAPRISRVGVLMDPEFRGFSELWLTIESMAPTFGLQAIAVHGRDSAEIEKAIGGFARQEDGGLIALPTPVNSVQRAQIFALATRHRLPAVYPFSFHARGGGLLSYGFDSVDLFKRAAPYVARILNGDKPGDLPVQAPTKFELVINLKAARAIGLEVSPTLLSRADEVIE